MTHTVVIDRNKFIKAVDASMKSLTAYILGGQCTSFEDYRNKTGQLRGIEVALGHFAETLKSEDDDE